MFTKINYFFWILFSLLFGIIFCSECISKEPSQEKLLRKALLCEYDRDTRPRVNSKESVNVSISMRIMNYHFEDTMRTFPSYLKGQSALTIGVWVVLSWMDDYLKWTPSDYGNNDEIVLASHLIWSPDVSLYNSADSVSSGNSFYSPCVVTYKGRVTCVPHMNFHAPCEPDYSRWPLDIQNCTMTFGTWMYKGEETRFQFRVVKQDAQAHNSYWKVLKIGKYSHSGEFVNLNATYPYVAIWLQLQRRSADGILFLITPAIVMIFLTVTSLLLDINSWERLFLVSINLIYHLYFLRNLFEIAPSSGITVPNSVAYFRDSTYLACAVLVEVMLLKSVVRRTDVVPRWVSLANNFINSGAGKIIMFHEFDPSATGIVSGDPETLNKEEMELVTKREWMRFALFVNRVFLIVVFITYVGLFAALLTF